MSLISQYISKMCKTIMLIKTFAAYGDCLNIIILENFNVLYRTAILGSEFNTFPPFKARLKSIQLKTFPLSL